METGFVILAAAAAAVWTKIVRGYRYLYDHSVGYLYPYTPVRGVVFALALDAILMVVLASIAQ